MVDSNTGGPLVIFDCDGVLVDSEPIANRVLAELLSQAGLPTTTEESMRRYTGRSLPGIIEEVEASLGRSIQRGTEFIDQYREGVFAGFREGLEPIAGVAQAIQAIARLARFGRAEGLSDEGLAICVASSSRPDRVELSLRLTGLLEHFEGRLFSAVEVERGKPAPDLFLHAARVFASMQELPGLISEILRLRGRVESPHSR